MTAATSRTQLDTYATALHECVRNIEKLEWNNPNKPEDKREIVKHLRAFIERTSPSWTKQSIEHAIHELHRAIASNYSTDPLTLSRIKRDIKVLNKHFANGDVFAEVENRRSILSFITLARLFGHRPTTAQAIENYQKEMSDLNDIIFDRERDVSSDYYVDQSKQLIDDLAKFSPEKADFYRERLRLAMDPKVVYGELRIEVHLSNNCSKLISFMARYAPEEADHYRHQLHGNLGVLYNEIVNDFTKSMKDIVLILKERLNHPERIEEYNASVDDIAFLKKFLNTKILSDNDKTELANLIVTHLAKDQRPRQPGTALDTLDQLEKTVQTQSKDKNRNARALLQKIDQLKEETLQEELSPKANNVISKVKASTEPGKHLKELVQVYIEIRENYVARLQEGLKKVGEGLREKDLWITRLKDDPEFEKSVSAFVDRFSKETNPSKQMLKWDLFVHEMKHKYAPEHHKTTAGIILAILATRPTDKFLHAILDIDPSILKAGSSLEARRPQLDSLRQIYQGFNTVLAPLTIKVKGVEFTKQALQTAKQRLIEEGECRNFISFLLRYNPDDAIRFQNRLLDPDVDLGVLRRDLLTYMTENLDPLLSSLQERIGQPERIGYHDNILNEIGLLKDMIKTKAFKEGPDFPFLVWSKLGEQADLGRNEQGFRQAALRTLDRVEKKIQENVHDKTYIAQRFLAKIDQLKQQSAKDPRFALTPEIEKLISDTKKSDNQGKYAEKLQKTYKQMKDKYVTELGHAINNYRLQDAEAVDKGFAWLSKEQRNLLANQDFKKHVVAFAGGFSAESDQYKKIHLWDSFVNEAMTKYAVNNKQQLIQTILLAYPAESFLHALVDLDDYALVIQRAPNEPLDHRNRDLLDGIYTGFKSMLNPPLSFEVEEMKGKIKQSYELLRDLKSEKALRKEVLELNKDTMETFRIPDMDEFIKDVKTHEQNVFKAYDAHFNRMRMNKLRTVEVKVAPADVKFFEKFIKEKNEAKKIAEFNTHFSQLKKKYRIADEQSLSFLQQLLLTCDKSVARAVKMMNKDKIEARRPGESEEDVHTRNQAYQLLSQAVNAILA